MTTGNLIVRAIATTLVLVLMLVLGLAGLAQAESLDIQPGLWKKTLMVETGGRTVMVSTVDACLTADDLDLQKTAEKLARSPLCTAVQQQLTPRSPRLRLAGDGAILALPSPARLRRG